MAFFKSLKLRGNINKIRVEEKKRQSNYSILTTHPESLSCPSSRRAHFCWHSRSSRSPACPWWSYLAAWLIYNHWLWRVGGEVHFNRLHKSISVDGHTRHWSCQFGTANWAPAISRPFLGTNTGLDLEKLPPGGIGKERRGWQKNLWWIWLTP